MTMPAQQEPIPPQGGCDVLDLPPMREGDTCPLCHEELLLYNGLLELECPACGFQGAQYGGFS